MAKIDKIVDADRPTPNISKRKELSQIVYDLVPPKQGELFHVEKQVEYDGVEMGVLENGIPYLSESGLARMCGVDRKVINRLAIGWSEEKAKPRGRIIRGLLEESGFTNNELFAKSEYNGTPTNAYTEPVCMAILEYYAFYTKESREQALHAFRALARRSFTAFIYSATGYLPDSKKLESWKHFHDRVNLLNNAVPDGYFCVFRELASMLVPMISSGIAISDKIVPDISVGLVWSKFWRNNKLKEEFGDRIKYDHEYPDYYPQSKSNPQEAWAYPDWALPIFRNWLKSVYIPTKFIKYLSGKVQKGQIAGNEVALLADAFKNKQIE